MSNKMQKVNIVDEIYIGLIHWLHPLFVLWFSVYGVNYKYKRASESLKRTKMEENNVLELWKDFDRVRMWLCVLHLLRSPLL